MFNVVCLQAGPYEENAYLCWVEGRPEALLVDPGDGANMLLEHIAKRGLRLTHILLTHGHFDHILAVAPLVECTKGVKVWIHPRDEAMLYDPYPLKLPPSVEARFHGLKLDGDSRVVGSSLTFPATGAPSVTIEMIETPGHTPGGVCFYVPQARQMFTGDTLFRDGYGRTDFANARAEDLRASLIKLLAMPDDIVIHPGHGEADVLGAVKRRFGV